MAPIPPLPPSALILIRSPSPDNSTDGSNMASGQPFPPSTTFSTSAFVVSIAIVVSSVVGASALVLTITVIVIIIRRSRARKRVALQRRIIGRSRAATATAVAAAAAAAAVVAEDGENVPRLVITDMSTVPAKVMVVDDGEQLERVIASYRPLTSLNSPSQPKTDEKDFGDETFAQVTIIPPTPEQAFEDDSSLSLSSSDAESVDSDEVILAYELPKDSKECSEADTDPVEDEGDNEESENVLSEETSEVSLEVQSIAGPSRTQSNGLIRGGIWWYEFTFADDSDSVVELNIRRSETDQAVALRRDASLPLVPYASADTITATTEPSDGDRRLSDGVIDSDILNYCFHLSSLDSPKGMEKSPSLGSPSSLVSSHANGSLRRHLTRRVSAVFVSPDGALRQVDLDSGLYKDLPSLDRTILEYCWRLSPSGTSLRSESLISSSTPLPPIPVLSSPSLQPDSPEAKLEEILDDDFVFQYRAADSTLGDLFQTDPSHRSMPFAPSASEADAVFAICGSKTEFAQEKAEEPMPTTCSPREKPLPAIPVLLISSSGGPALEIKVIDEEEEEVPLASLWTEKHDDRRAPDRPKNMKGPKFLSNFTTSLLQATARVRSNK